MERVPSQHLGEGALSVPLPPPPAPQQQQQYVGSGGGGGGGEGEEPAGAGGGVAAAAGGVPTPMTMMPSFGAPGEGAGALVGFGGDGGVVGLEGLAELPPGTTGVTVMVEGDGEIGGGGGTLPDAAAVVAAGGGGGKKGKGKKGQQQQQPAATVQHGGQGVPGGVAAPANLTPDQLCEYNVAQLWHYETQAIQAIDPGAWGVGYKWVLAG